MPQEPSILINARKLAQQFGQTFDTLHIAATPLLNAGAAGDAGAIVAAIPRAQQDAWAKLLYETARSTPPPPAFTGGPTARLIECERLWKQAAAQHTSGLSDILVLVTVLRFDAFVGEMMRAPTIAIDGETLLQRLDAQLTQLDAAASGSNIPGGWPGAQQGAAWPGAGQDPNDRFGSQAQWTTGPMAAMTPQEQAAAAQARRLTLPVRYTPGLGYRAMFLSDMIEFLGQLDTSTRGIDLFVLSGMNGSPATRFGEVLAGRLAMGERFDGQHPALAGYRGVMTIDVRPLVTPALPGGADASRVLAMALDGAAGAHSILMVDHIEALDGTESPRPELWNVLLSRGQVVAFGLYWTATDADPRLQRRPGMPPVVPRHTPACTPLETSNLINQVYAPYWASQYGVIVPTDIPGVFADIYALERGAHVRGQRITLPFLAVEVADNAIRRARNGGVAAVADTTAGALTEIGRLRTDKDVPEANKAPFAHALKEAERAILALGKPPRLQIDQNDMIRLTRAQVTAQLIDVNESYFAYPQQP